LGLWFDNDARLPQERLNIVYGSIGALTLLLLSGFWKLQIIDTEKYAQMAERNRIRALPILAPRGRILDREGRELVSSYPSFSVRLLREDADLVAQKLPEIAEGIEVPMEELRERLEESRLMPKFYPIEIKPEATPADIAFIESHRADIPVLELLMVHRRKYPADGFLSHAVGYVGEVSEKEIERSGGKYQPGDIVGKAGLEKQYNHILMGQDGMRRVVVNSIGKEVSRLEHKEAIPGNPITLTIDLDLQVVAEEALRGQKGAVVALDPRTGEVLAFASQPSPDPNKFAVRVPREEWKRLIEDREKPMLNRVVQAQLAPGSVFKIIMGAAMLESKAVPEDFSTYCSGSADFYGRVFRCHILSKGRGHGFADLHTAIVQSCDIFFYSLGKRLGIDRISAYAKQFGLGRKTGIDLPSEESGLVPSEEWKLRTRKEKWYAGETISVAIGQGALITTPLQLARTIGGLANGGKFFQPHLLKGLKDVATEEIPVSENTTEQLTKAMWGVVNEGGTAAGSRLQGIEFCGKTGTAQLISLEGLKKAGRGRAFTDNAWFVGYAPRRSPEIVISVLVEHGEHGSSAAAPIARDIVKRYYEKKQQVEKQQTTAAAQPGAPVPAAAAVAATLTPQSRP
jgi:penicillin-binding protein 2